MRCQADRKMRDGAEGRTPLVLSMHASLLDEVFDLVLIMSNLQNGRLNRTSFPSEDERRLPPHSHST